jgi:hypothetical protein
MSLQVNLLDIDRHVKLVTLENVSTLVTTAFYDDRVFLDAVDRVIRPRFEELLDAIAQEGDDE